mmetsp:Transcript_18469/g.47214  ORF Transcript_18469/g.47214 Transcript_18469/m.47214 type:complete len:242 (-) Transcript_18469:2736-3461(-)
MSKIGTPLKSTPMRRAVTFHFGVRLGAETTLPFACCIKNSVAQKLRTGESKSLAVSRRTRSLNPPLSHAHNSVSGLSPINLRGMQQQCATNAPQLPYSKNSSFARASSSTHGSKLSGIVALLVDGVTGAVTDSWNHPSKMKAAHTKQKTTTAAKKLTRNFIVYSFMPRSTRVRARRKYSASGSQGTESTSEPSSNVILALFFARFTLRLRSRRLQPKPISKNRMGIITFTASITNPNQGGT